MSMDDDLGRQSLLALFHEEAQTQTRVLSTGLLTLERTPADAAAEADAKTDAPAAPSVTFTAEDIRVRPYGDTAALTFRLVQHGPDGQVATYRNSGMFVRRDGRWQAVTWQATKVPEPAAEEKK